MNPRVLALVLAVGVGSASAGDPGPKPKDVKPTDPAPAKKGGPDKPSDKADPATPIEVRPPKKAGDAVPGPDVKPPMKVDAPPASASPPTILPDVGDTIPAPDSSGAKPMPPAASKPAADPVPAAEPKGMPAVPPGDRILTTTPPILSAVGAADGGPTWWVAGDYMMWWTKAMPVNNPLVTTGPETDPFAGTLDQPRTRVVYGDKAIDFGVLSGLRLQAGLWLDDDATFGVEVVGMMLQQARETATFSGGGNGQPFFGIPFVNARTGQQNIYFVSQNVSDPAMSAFLTGDLDITSTSRFWAYEVNGLVNLYRSPERWLVATAGFRSMGLDETISVSESLRSLIPAGSVTFGGATVDQSQRVGTLDEFRTENRFYGPQVGTRAGAVLGGMFISAYASVALGVNQQERTISGSTALVAGSRVLNTLPGGVFALSSNIGKTTQNEFSVVPEAGLSLGYEFTPWLTARLGYNFVYWNNVQRATQQIDSTINPGLVPSDISYGTPGGPTRPGSVLRTSDFWAQGINFGIEIKR